MRKSIVLAVLYFLTCNLAFSQTYGTFDLYNYDPKMINPAFAGLINEQNYHVQFSGGDSDYPYTALTAFSTRINGINSGIGAMLWRSERGPFRENSTRFLYNYQFKFGNNKCLSIGVQSGYTDLYLDEPLYTLINLGDDLLINEDDMHSKTYTGDIGVVYKVNNFHLGISTENLVYSQQAATLFYNTPYRIYNIFSMHQFEMASWLKFQPSILVRTALRDLSYVDLNGIFVLKNFILLGAAAQYRNGDIYQNYNAGIDIKKKLQFIGTLYAGAKHRNYSPPFSVELMLRLRIANRERD